MTYASSALEGELTKLRQSQAGRNNTLFAVAARLYQLVEAGAFEEHVITQVLTVEARNQGLLPGEITSVLRSAWKVAEGNPAILPDAARRPGGNQMHRPPPDPQPPEPCDPPPAAWQACAAAFVAWSSEQLWDERDETALDYLWHKRKLLAQTVSQAGLGYNPQRLIRSRAKWGLPASEQGSDVLVLPPGIVVPYIGDRREIWKLEICQIPTGRHTVAGSANALWNVRAVHRSWPTILVEGVYNGLTVLQEAGDLGIPVALGASTHGRRVRWIAALAQAPQVLVATDTGKAGDTAAAYWLDALGPTARRWRPYADDCNTMARDGMDVRAWVQAGLANTYAHKDDPR